MAPDSERRGLDCEIDRGERFDMAELAKPLSEDAEDRCLCRPPRYGALRTYRAFATGGILRGASRSEPSGKRFADRVLATAASADPYNPGDRALTGGLLGADTGAVIGAIAGGGRGAGIGAAVGEVWAREPVRRLHRRDRHSAHTVATTGSIAIDAELLRLVSGPRRARRRRDRP